MTEHQVARPIYRISLIGASTELPTRANAKRAVFYEFCKEMSQGKMKLILRGMHWWCFQGMTVFTGHEMGPPLCGTGNGRDGDKLLCNRCPLKHEARERERGEMLYDNVSNWKHRCQKICIEKYNWYLKYMTYVVWVQPSMTEYTIIKIQGMDAAIQ